MAVAIYFTFTANRNIIRRLYYLLGCQLHVISYSIVDPFSPKNYHFCFLMIPMI